MAPPRIDDESEPDGPPSPSGPRSLRSGGGGSVRRRRILPTKYSNPSLEGAKSAPPSQDPPSASATPAPSAAEAAPPSSATSTSTSAAPPKPPKIDASIDKAVDDKIVYEFGGPIGVTLLMLTFPVLMLYFYIVLHSHSGALVWPTSQFWTDGLPHVTPNLYAAKLYLGFNVWQAFLAMTLPGVEVKGLPVPSLGGRQLTYLCNGVASWYVDLLLLPVLHCTGLLPLGDIVDNLGPIMAVAMIYGIVVSILTYVIGVSTGSAHRMSGNVPYDLFMGAPLNPKIGNLDLKMWSEIRIPWKVLFLISLSACVKEHELNAAAAAAESLPSHFDLLDLGWVSLPVIRTSAPLLFMLLAHTLYVNACMKGEECIPTTWDIFYEKWGYMLIFWNFAGVPFSYCYSTLYLLNRSLAGEPIVHPAWYQGALFAVLLGAYYVWDTANSQKNRFRMQERGTYVKRHTFPQLPWGTLEDPTYLETRRGTKLLTGGWWGVARKIHYTADLVMALTWGLVAGTDSPVPYFYAAFFFTVLTHRVSRDMELCREKYGADWDEYCRIVPYIFVPYIF